MTRLWILVGAVVLAAGIGAGVWLTRPRAQPAAQRAAASFTPHAEPTDDEGDEIIFDQLIQAGIDLSKPLPLAFALNFAEQESARAACASLKGEGFRISVEQPPDPESWWMCEATKDMIPSREAIAATRAHMRRVAEDNEGEYDGWEVALPE